MGAAIGKGYTRTDNAIFHKVDNGDWSVLIFKTKNKLLLTFI